MLSKANEKSESILKRLENDFHRDILKSSIAVLTAPDVTTKFSNFATNIRELTRLLFYELAPDNEVENCDWYEKVPLEEENGITRLDRMTYAIKGGLSNSFIEKELGFDFKKETKLLNKVIGVLNKYTHINEKVYYRSVDLHFKMVENTLISLDEFLKTIERIRSIIIKKLEALIHDSVSNALTDDVINELDIIATHYWIEGSWINDVNIINITSSDIRVVVEGSVDVRHQYGSDNDFKKGDGLLYENSYPLSLSLTLNVSKPLEFDLTTNQINVDNSNFYE